MFSEEKALRNLRNRKLRITVWVTLTIPFSGTLVYGLATRAKLERLTAPEHIRSMVSFESLDTELPVLLSTLCKWSAFNASLTATILFLGLCTGWLIANLIIDLAGRHRLLLAMWERLQRLENIVKDLDGPSTENDPPTAATQD